jgi:hypothetical protein
MKTATKSQMRAAQSAGFEAAYAAGKAADAAGVPYLEQADQKRSAHAAAVESFLLARGLVASSLRDTRTAAEKTAAHLAIERAAGKS